MGVVLWGLIFAAGNSNVYAASESLVKISTATQSSSLTTSQILDRATNLRQVKEADSVYKQQGDVILKNRGGEENQKD